jgi:hypothetical protein
MNENFFNLELVFEKNIEVNEELKNKIVNVIQECKLDADDDLPELSDFYNDFHKYAKIDGHSIKAECKCASIPDSSWIIIETESKCKDLINAFKDIKIGIKLRMSYEGCYPGPEGTDCSIITKYYVGLCKPGEYKKLWEADKSNFSFGKFDEIYDDFFYQCALSFDE